MAAKNRKRFSRLILPMSLCPAACVHSAVHGPATSHAVDGNTLKFSPGKTGDIDVTANLKKISGASVLCHNERSPTWDPERYTVADGTKSGFDYDQATAKVAHLNPKKH